MHFLLRKNDEEIKEPQLFYINDVFAPILFEYVDKPIKKFSFRCIPGPKFMNYEWAYFWKKIFFDPYHLQKLKFCTKSSRNLKLLEQFDKFIEIKHFHDTAWL